MFRSMRCTHWQTIGLQLYLGKNEQNDSCLISPHLNRLIIVLALQARKLWKKLNNLPPLEGSTPCSTTPRSKTNFIFKSHKICTILYAFFIYIPITVIVLLMQPACNLEDNISHSSLKDILITLCW